MDWHPFIVHYPIALWSVALGIDLFAWIRRRADWHHFAYVLQALAAVGALAAVLTGNSAAAPYREDGGVSALVQQHEDWASVTLLFMLVAVLGRLPLHLQGLQGRRLGLWVAVAGLGTCGVWLTAHYGGELVYEHGVGVLREERTRNQRGGDDDAGDSDSRSGQLLERAGEGRADNFGRRDGPGEHDRGRLADAGQHGTTGVRHWHQHQEPEWPQYRGQS